MLLPQSSDYPFKLTIQSPNQVLHLDVNSSISVRLALDATELRVRAACGGLGSCGACLIQIVSGDFNPPTIIEWQKILPDDLATGMRLACQLYAQSHGKLFLQNPAPHSDWKSLGEAGLYRPDIHDVVTVPGYGVAVDLGTTQIRLSLWNLKNGRRIASRYSINPQIAFGADILTRLDAGQLNEAKNQMLTDLGRRAIIEGIRDILSRDMGEVSPILNQIARILIVGNTAMLKIICRSDDDSLYQPENWQQAIQLEITDMENWRKSWRCPHANISIVQPLAGFIGSDLLADLAISAITETKHPCLLADFGTNTEIALWDGATLWVTSVPGGPAFEGVGLRNGLSAEAGAICSVSKNNNKIHFNTIDDEPARGFCANGYIDAIAALLENGLLKSSGRFSSPLTERGFLLDSENIRTAIFTKDIDLFQRAKAATASAMKQLLLFSDLSIKDVSTLWICGNFGQHLNFKNAQRIGLLPEIADEKILVMANASLAGCEKLLMMSNSTEFPNSIASYTRVINMSCVPEYEENYIENLRLIPMNLK